MSSAVDVVGITRNVRTFGALGDDATDDTAAFLSAIAAVVAAGGGRVFVPRGKYILNGGAASADGYKNGLLVPFLQINSDETKTIVIEGEGGSHLKCGSNNMVLVRVSRNNVTLRDLTLDSNGKTGVILCGVVPEDMTQTTTQVGQSHVTLDNVDRVGGPSVDGLVYQPGPQVAASDSGCFYHNVFGGVSNFVGGGRHVHFKKNADFASHPNKTTRTSFYGHKCLRGNVGYHGEAVSELLLSGCSEELITSGATPIATPTARYFTNDCSNITFLGGYSEACSASVEGFTANGVVRSMGYIPASGGNTTFRTYVDSYADAISPFTFEPVLASSGGGAQGAENNSGLAWKNGKIVTFHIEINVAKGTLGAGNLSITGLPHAVNTSGPGIAGVNVAQNGAITLSAGYAALGGFITGAAITLRKSSITGNAVANLTLAECGDPVQLVLSGSYIAA